MRFKKLRLVVKIVNSNYQIYKVGGAVRDKLLGIESSDNDYVVVGADPKTMKKLGFIEVGKSFPVFLDSKNREEYALARKEQKTGLGYQGFKFEIENVTLEEDLKRRDLTINAIAENRNGDLIDPFNGIQDLQNRILKHVSISFREDPVRVLRLARFQAIFPNFQIAESTKELVLDMLQNGELKSLTKERIYIELQKMVLKSNSPHLFFKSLDNLQVLQEIFPYLKIENLDYLKEIGKISNLELISILSLHIDSKILRNELLLENSIYTNILRFQRFNHLFNENLEVETILNIMQIFKTAEQLEIVISLFNKIYRKNIDQTLFHSLFLEYKDAGKVLITLQHLPKKEKISFLYNLRLKLLNNIIINSKMDTF